MGRKDPKRTGTVDVKFKALSSQAYVSNPSLLVTMFNKAAVNSPLSIYRVTGLSRMSRNSGRYLGFVYRTSVMYFLFSSSSNYEWKYWQLFCKKKVIFINLPKKVQLKFSNKSYGVYIPIGNKLHVFSSIGKQEINHQNVMIKYLVI